VINAEFPEKLSFVFDRYRNKVAYGGRGSAKSWSFAKALLIRGVQEKRRVPCCREIQKSLSDSVHALLSEQIKLLGLESFYTVQENAIIGRNETLFTFHGLKHNVNSIKSLEGADDCWVEEAQTVSKKSWETLIPTIRKDGSEIWVTFNPDLETDDTYQRFVANSPPDSKVVKINYTDNPWCPAVLQAEAEHLKATNPDAYNHVWLGCCINVLDGAIFAEELRKVDAEQRVTRIPYDPTKPVHTFWDLGWGDLTSIWFVQSFPFEFRVIDYLEGSGKALKYYQSELQTRGYVYGTHYLPHDAEHGDLGTGRSIKEQMVSAGFPVAIVPRMPKVDQIEAARAVFGATWFDGQKCADGLQALRHYRYGEIEKLNTKTREPLHDWASHPSDAFMYFACSVEKLKRGKVHAPLYGGGSWSS
jgi:phage terminase large subunit